MEANFAQATSAREANDCSVLLFAAGHGRARSTKNAALKRPHIRYGRESAGGGVETARDFSYRIRKLRFRLACKSDRLLRRYPSSGKARLFYRLEDLLIPGSEIKIR